jgi:hypothetical protein
LNDASSSGLTVITIVVGVVPAQAFADGVIVYVAVCAVVDEFVNVCAIVFPDPADTPVNEAALVLTVHVNVDPATLLVSATEVVLPEQIVVATAVAVATGIGLTITVVVIGVPGQAFAVGVIVYVAVCAVVEELFNVCAIVAPAPAEVPVRDAALVVTVQSNVAPATVLVKATEVVLPEQIV